MSRAAAEIAEAIADNEALRTVDLARNKIGKAGGAALLEALRSNHLIKDLSLGKNTIPKDVEKEAARHLRKGEARRRQLAHRTERSEL